MCGAPYLKRDLFVCFYHEQTSNGNIYLETLEKFASSQIQELQPNLIVQQDVASPSRSYLLDSSLTTFSLCDVLGVAVQSTGLYGPWNRHHVVFSSGTLFGTEFIKQKSLSMLKD